MNLMAKELREVCAQLRKRPIPLVDLIPMMQRAADALEAADRVGAEGWRRLAESQHALLTISDGKPIGYVDPQRLRDLQNGKEPGITLVAESEADLSEGGDVPVYLGTR